MVFLLAVLVPIVLSKIKFSSFHHDYMGKDQSTAIKGVFAVIIVFSHIKGYLQPKGILDSYYFAILGLIGQLMVTLFFFYSGYGIFCAWQRKPEYVKGFFRKRIVKTWLHFALAVLLFAGLNLILGIPQTKENWIFCWIAWGTIGNSNWFIFDTLVFYLMALVLMGGLKKKSASAYCLWLSALCVLFWAVMRLVRGAETWWYDTILCFPAGAWYGLLKERIDKAAEKPVFWWCGLAGIGVVFALLYLHGHIVAFSLCAPMFCVLVVWITMKVRFCNGALLWLGQRSFSIYITQRLPMILFSHLGWNGNKPLFVALVLLTVFPVAEAFHRLLQIADRKLFI